MNQTRIGSLIQVAINIAIGFGINWIANLCILPCTASRLPEQAFTMGLIFTVISVARVHHPALVQCPPTAGGPAHGRGHGMRKTSTYARKRRHADPLAGLRLLDKARPFDPGDTTEQHIKTRA